MQINDDTVINNDTAGLKISVVPGNDGGSGLRIKRHSDCVVGTMEFYFDKDGKFEHAAIPYTLDSNI